MAAALFRCHEHHVAHELRSRADDGHIALQYVEEFGEFVKARAAEELAVLGEANVIWEQVPLGVAGIGHGAELDELEDLLVLPGTQLREEGIPLHLDGSQNRKHDENRAQADDGQERTEEVDDSLKHASVHEIPSISIRALHAPVYLPR